MYNFTLPRGFGREGEEYLADSQASEGFCGFVSCIVSLPGKDELEASVNIVPFKEPLIIVNTTVQEPLRDSVLRGFFRHMCECACVCFVRVDVEHCRIGGGAPRNGGHIVFVGCALEVTTTASTNRVMSAFSVARAFMCVPAQLSSLLHFLRWQRSVSAADYRRK